MNAETSTGAGEPSGDTHGLPPHIAEALIAIDRLHQRHERASGPVQRQVDRATRQFARPGTVIVLLAIVALWLIGNLAMGPRRAADGPPFQWLQVAMGLISVSLTCMILTTQRRANLLASNRAHLTLQLAIIAEQKSAKTIALLEELRRDLPMLGNRFDDVADQLAQPTDAAMVIERLVEQTEELQNAPGDEVI